VLVLALSISAVVSSPAHAVGYTTELQFDQLQPGERTYVYPDAICPTPTAGNDFQYLLGTFTDSNNAVFPEIYIGSTTSSGSWSRGSFGVPDNAALGGGSLTVYCAEGWPWVSTMEYDAVSMTVVGQTTGVTVDKTNIWGTATFSSLTNCDANVPVEIDIHDQSNASYGGASYFGTDFSATVASSSSGSWSYSIEVTPANGFSNPWYAYTLRAVCMNAAGDYTYGSYNFLTKADQYVAMGDSYSSGVGNDNYDLNGGYCTRSLDAYGFYLSDNSIVNPPDFIPCAGAVTDDLYTSFMIESPRNYNYSGQLSRLNVDTEFVTLTIGGNDVGFSDVLNECVQYTLHPGFGCANDATVMSNTSSRISKLAGFGSATSPPPADTVGLPNRTIHSYVDILNAVTTEAPNATVYIAGYPHLFGSDSSNYSVDSGAPGGATCTVYSGVTTVNSVYISYADAIWMNDRVDDINEVIQDAVESVNSSRVVYVPLPAFEGHGLCDEEQSFINGVKRNTTDGGPTIDSFHPNLDGMHLGYGEAFLDAMN